MLKKIFLVGLFVSFLACKKDTTETVAKNDPEAETSIDVDDLPEEQELTFDSEKMEDRRQ